MRQYNSDQHGEDHQNAEGQDDVGFKEVAEGKQVHPVLQHYLLKRGELAQRDDLVELVMVPTIDLV